MENKNVQELKALRTEITRFLMTYRFALKEIQTKVDILNEEFQAMNQ
jgi:putative GTP pyrophosphokinase